MGLSCYEKVDPSSGKIRSFNALMGLSCYEFPKRKRLIYHAFQCPHGLELLQDGDLLYTTFDGVSMPSWA